MRLICQKCKKTRLVHSGHYWRYHQPRRCECGGELNSDQAGLLQMKSRDKVMKSVLKVKRMRD